MTFAFLPLLDKWKANGELAKKFVPQVVMASNVNGWTKVSTSADFIHISCDVIMLYMLVLS